MFISLIKRWYKRRKYDQLTASLISRKDFSKFFPDFVEWLELTLPELDEEALYRRRFKPEFENIEDLGLAIEIMTYNLSNNDVRGFDNVPSHLRVEDWLVDNESYRFTMEEFFTKYTDKLKRISVGLSNLNKSGLQYHLSGAHSIIVTLQALVETCHRR